jgi:hypothetical protein
MAYAVSAAEVEITVDRIVEFHRRLLLPTRHAKHAGRIRTVQNWIGARRTAHLAQRLSSLHVLQRRRTPNDRASRDRACAVRNDSSIRRRESTRYEGLADSPVALSSTSESVSLFAVSCSRAVADVEVFEARVEALRGEWRERLGTAGAGYARFVAKRIAKKSRGASYDAPLRFRG